MSRRDHIADQLRRLAAGPRPEDRFAIGRVQVAGEPHGWYESITLERGVMQQCLRTRSQADAGGAPIGEWRSPAEDRFVQETAAALCKVQAWTVDSVAELQPGMEIVNWSCVTADALLDIVVPSGSPVLQQFMPVDLALRRIANTLEESGAGSLLRVALQCKPHGGQIAVRVGLINDGAYRSILVNPFVGTPSATDYFRLEIAPLAADQPGETGYGAVFVPLPVEIMPESQRSDPWADPYLVLGAAGRLLLPQTLMIELPALGRFIMRAVYSSHGALDQIAGVTVIRGRAFSNEVVVEK
jgi:hypothetical protein